MANRGVTVRCVVCGLEVTGVLLPDGTVHPSNRVRPEPGAPIRDGYCWRDAPKGKMP